MSSIVVCPVPGSRFHTLAPDALVRTVQRDLRVGERHRRGREEATALKADACASLQDVPGDARVHERQLARSARQYQLRSRCPRPGPRRSDLPPAQRCR